MPSTYGYTKFLLVQFYLILCARFGWSKYIIPDLQFEAYSPKGLRVSMPGEDKVRQFNFHGKVNGELNELEPGELVGEVRFATNGRWVYDDPNVVLHVGDTIGYWVFVQYDFFGYRKDNMSWRVDELMERSSSGKEANNCQKSITIANGKQVKCKRETIFQDSFDNLDPSKWVVEQYIPFNGPNFEFCYYSPESVRVNDSQLTITPVPKRNEEEIRGTLDLTRGCTSSFGTECYYVQQAAQYLPPVKSGKIRSKFSFKYGRVEIDAKLPCGDWIYPEVSLIPTDDTNPGKIYVAYSRGNALLQSANEEIGGQLLFSGFSSSSKEPVRSEKLSSTRNNKLYCQESHKFKVIWNADEILSYVDGHQFGQSRHTAHPNSEYYISLGVSVGGNNDFPNNYTTTNNREKPWTNEDVRQFKNFFAARNDWLPTWSSGSSLVVKSVRVIAV